MKSRDWTARLKLIATWDRISERVDSAECVIEKDGGFQWHGVWSIK